MRSKTSDYEFQAGGESARRVEIQGVSVHYHDIGSGTPLLMLPSFGPMPGTTAWLTFHKVLGWFAREYRCILMDLPNYGLTGPVEYHVPLHDFFAEVAVGLMRHLGFDSWIALGNSQGGQVCKDMALLYPECVSRVVCGAGHISTGGDNYTLSNFPSEGRRLAEEAQADPYDAQKLRRFLRALVYDETLITDQVFQSIYDIRTSSREFWDAIEASPMVVKNNVASTGRIAVPMLVLHGRFDREVPYETSLAMVSNVRSADFVLLNNCGHWSPFERPEHYASHVLGFLDQTGEDL